MNKFFILIILLALLILWGIIDYNNVKFEQEQFQKQQYDFKNWLSKSSTNKFLVQVEDQEQFNYFLKENESLALLRQKNPDAYFALNKFGHKDKSLMNFYKNLSNPFTPDQYKNKIVQDKRNHQDLPIKISLDLRHQDITVKDQQNFNSAWSFAATGLLENKFSQEKLSEQELIDCFLEKNESSKDPALSILDYVQHYGIHYQKNYKYQGEVQTCKKNTINYFPSKFFSSYLNLQTPVFVQNNCHALKVLLNERGPVLVAVKIDTPGQEWFYYKSGILGSDQEVEYQNIDNQIPNNSFNNQPNHAALLVGYKENYWIVKNSWGSDWGENGYIKIKMGNYAGICSIGIAF